MKTSRILAFSSVALVSLLLSGAADAGVLSKFKKFFPKPRPRPPVVVPAPPPPPPVHVHHYVTRSRQVWVPPVYNTVVVGYQPCGTPIYQQVLVQAGYYRTVYYRVCACGHQVG